MIVATNSDATRAPQNLATPEEPLVCLIGADTVVGCLRGDSRRYVNLDYAASTPVMAAVWGAVEAFIPWYSSVHRGSGLKSQVSTAAFEDARDTVARFLNARQSREVVFVRGTTEAINLVAATFGRSRVGPGDGGVVFGRRA